MARAHRSRVRDSALRGRLRTEFGARRELLSNPDDQVAYGPDGRLAGSSSASNPLSNYLSNDPTCRDRQRDLAWHWEPRVGSKNFSHDSMILWTLITFRRNRRRYSQLMNSNEGPLSFVRLRSQGDCEKFLRLATAARSSQGVPSGRPVTSDLRTELTPS